MSLPTKAKPIIPAVHMESLGVLQETCTKMQWPNVAGIKAGYQVSLILVKVESFRLHFKSKILLYAATFCQSVPFPPKKIGMVYRPDEKNNISFASGKI